MQMDEVTGEWVFTHSLTDEQIAKYVGAAEEGYDGYDPDRLARAVASSYATIDDILASNCWRAVPQALYDEAVLRLTHEFYKAQNNVTMSDPSNVYRDAGAPTRGPRDTFSLVRPLLSRYLRGGFA